jgi:uncharacterized protein YuzE
MKVTYDPKVDAAYIYLTKVIKEPETKQIDEDILVDFDAEGRLLGIEVLDASHRLDLSYVWPRKGRRREQSVVGHRPATADWVKLREKLVVMKRENQLLETTTPSVRGEILQVGEDFVLVVLLRSASPLRSLYVVTKEDFASSDQQLRYKRLLSLVKALRKLTEAA